MENILPMVEDESKLPGIIPSHWEVLPSVIMQEKKRQNKQKEDIKLLLFIDGMLVYIKVPKESRRIYKNN